VPALNEFVYKEGGDGNLEFVGEFEGLYKASPDPWSQSAATGKMAEYYKFSRQQLAISISANVRGFKKEELRGLEIGCGLGHVVDLLSSFTRVEFEGMDVSATAIARAVLQYRNKFYVGDITTPVSLPKTYDVIVLGQMLWYILHAMPTVMDNCIRALAPGGLLVVSQAFLTSPQRYGRDIADGFSGALKLFTGFTQFHLIEARYEDTLGLIHNDGLLVLRKINDAT
jgi:SAM-dependent methyltransferase